MANGKIQKYADAVNLQVAAEAFLKNAKFPENVPEAIVEGNKNNSKQPTVISKLFETGVGARYKLVAHQDLTQNEELTVQGVTNKSGFSASIFLDTQTQQYTLSFRSTEFADNIRDPGDVRADAAEIGPKGWAFGQIYSMEAFWASLLNGTARHGINAVTILDQQALADFRASMTQLGGKVNVTGYSLGGNLAEAFTELHRGQVNHTYMFNGAGTGKAMVAGGFPALWQAFMTAFDAWKPGPGEATSYTSLYDNPRYKKALQAISNKVLGAMDSSAVLSSTADAPRAPDSKITDIYAYHYLGRDAFDTATARSGIRHGEDRPIWYEDQPLADWAAQGVPQWDWATGHSIVLLQDSLNLMAAFERLSPLVTEDALAAIFSGSSLRPYDSLEKSLDHLARLVGIATPVKAATADNQFAQMDLRNAFHDRLKQVTDSAVFKSLAGKIKIDATHPGGADVARGDFAALVSLVSGASFSLRSVDAQAVQAALGPIHAQAYADWQADKAALAAGVPVTALNFTDTYLNDRSALLNWRTLAHSKDESFVNSAYAPADRSHEYHWRDGASTQDNVLLVSRTQGPGASPAIVIAFGGDAGDTLTGNANAALGDRLYGGGGNDILHGLAGNDWLEGNAGDDRLEGGTGHDTLLGGKGNDTYVISTGAADRASITDADGKGKVLLGSVTLNGGASMAGGNDWVGADGTAYHLEGNLQTGGTLVVDGRLTINNFKNGDLGITLQKDVVVPEGASSFLVPIRDERYKHELDADSEWGFWYHSSTEISVNLSWEIAAVARTVFQGDAANPHLIISYGACDQTANSIDTAAMPARNVSLLGGNDRAIVRALPDGSAMGYVDGGAGADFVQLAIGASVNAVSGGGGADVLRKV
ncbi:MAG: calcium-binding protein [Ramlibacter sp.]